METLTIQSGVGGVRGPRLLADCAAVVPCSLQCAGCVEQVFGDGLVEVDEAGCGVRLQAERLAGQHGQDPGPGDVSGAVVIEADLFRGDRDLPAWPATS